MKCLTWMSEYCIIHFLWDKSIASGPQITSKLQNADDTAGVDRMKGGMISMEKSDQKVIYLEIILLLNPLL